MTTELDKKQMDNWTVKNSQEQMLCRTMQGCNSWVITGGMQLLAWNCLSKRTWDCQMGCQFIEIIPGMIWGTTGLWVWNLQYTSVACLMRTGIMHIWNYSLFLSNEVLLYKFRVVWKIKKHVDKDDLVGTIYLVFQKAFYKIPQ